MSLFKGNLDLPDPDKNTLPEEENLVLDKLAKQVVKRGMTVPAILFLESVKPLNFIGAQVLVFFEPIIQTLFNFKDYNTFRVALEKRETIEILLLKIEKLDAVALKREKLIKKYAKEQKKNWKWYQRYLGIFTPKIDIPEELLKTPDDGVKPDENSGASNQT